MVRSSIYDVAPVVSARKRTTARNAKAIQKHLLIPLKMFKAPLEAHVAQECRQLQLKGTRDRVQRCIDPVYLKAQKSFKADVDLGDKGHGTRMAEARISQTQREVSFVMSLARRQRTWFFKQGPS